MSKFTEELQSLSPSSTVELFVLDMSNTTSGGVLYFHAGTNELNASVVWQGNTYTPWPVEASGFDTTTQGTLPQPKIKVANTAGMFSGETAANNDLLGCKIIRKRTFAKFLDAVNFKDGVNPDADPTQHAEDDIWFIEQKLSENRYELEFQLSSVFDLMGVQLPNRQILKTACVWKYRGTECGYSGPSYDRFDKPSSATDDSCAKLLSSCTVRFGSSNPLPYGGFPGATKYDV